MLDSFFQAICRVGIFMICSQAIVHFRPQEVYEKYLKLLVSVMVLIQLFLPLGSFLLGGGREEAVRLLEQFGLELEQSMENAAKNAAATDEILERMTLEEVMRQLEAQNKNGVNDSAEGQSLAGDTFAGDGELGEDETGAGSGRAYAGENEVKIEIEKIDPVTIASPKPRD
jgi:hypothetical protein